MTSRDVVIDNILMYAKQACEYHRHGTPYEVSLALDDLFFEIRRLERLQGGVLFASPLQLLRMSKFDARNEDTPSS